MAIPKITFNIESDGLNRTAASIQKIPGFVLTGNTVATKVTIGESYKIVSLKQAEELGIEEIGVNAFAYKHIAKFYEKAGQGAPLWFMLVSDATTLTEMMDKTNPYAKKLIEDAGNIRVFGALKKHTGTETITDGLDADLKTAVVKAQELVTHFTNKYFPFRVILSGNKFSGNEADLFDYSTSQSNAVNVLIANDDASFEASIGLALGKQIAIPSQRRQSRIKDGAVIPLQAYFTNGEKVETLSDSWDAIDDKRYTFFRNFSNRSGYYFTGDKTLTSQTDDLSTLAPGFVMDEAMLIAYGVLTEELSDEIPVSSEGKIHPAIIKSWQANIDTQITRLMVDKGKLSGVKTFIDQNQNILQDETLTVTLKLLPVGYADFIEVNIGFTTTLNN